MSRQTVFRIWPPTDRFLGAIAAEARVPLELPSPPRTVDELLRAPRLLYEALEARQKLVIAGMHSDISDRMRAEAIRARSLAVRAILDDHAPRAVPRERKLAAANICYHLVATTWHYLRFYLHLRLRETIACAERAIRLDLDALASGGQPAV